MPRCSDDHPVIGRCSDFAATALSVRLPIGERLVWPTVPCRLQAASRVRVGSADRTFLTRNRAEQLRFHLPNAVKNGVKEEELIEAITHLAFYSGWPNAMSAMGVSKEFF